jgi:predicted peptidase
MTMVPNTQNRRGEARLLRRPYESTATGERREYFIYLPAGYRPEGEELWPVMLFLHGGGERGDGLDDLDYALRHGPLHEAWLQHRDLPFIMIGPQLPVFDQDWQVQLRSGVPRPARLASGPAPRAQVTRPDRPMRRAPKSEPAEFGVTEAWGDDGPPGGWQLCQEDLLSMVDTVLAAYNGDPDRVYLTGLSYGGYGSFYLAAVAPERWAAVAPICGDANTDLVVSIAEAQMPIWIFHGGRDVRVKPEWVYDVANALEEAGHRSVRLTIHEDLPHDAWTRVYAGQDLYDWFLSH